MLTRDLETELVFEAWPKYASIVEKRSRERKTMFGK